MFKTKNHPTQAEKINQPILPCFNRREVKETGAGVLLPPQETGQKTSVVVVSSFFGTRRNLWTSEEKLVAIPFSPTLFPDSQSMRAQLSSRHDCVEVSRGWEERKGKVSP
jgi:hypothetical protein